ncbi:hypothetical protein MTO96_039200 [Rhipicephalus appendiculatus]
MDTSAISSHLLCFAMTGCLLRHRQMRAAVPISTSGDAADIYGVEKCVEMYDAAIAPVAPTVAALLDSFVQAFLNSADLHVDRQRKRVATRRQTNFSTSVVDPEGTP